MNKTRMAGHIKNGQVIWFKMSVDGAKRHNSFLVKNEGKRIEAIIEIDDGPAYWIHQLYRGYYLPDITHAMGEKSRPRIHKQLKWEYNGVKCENIEEIPKDITIDQLVIVGGKVQGYVISMAKFKLEEAKGFMDFCKYRLEVDLNSHIGVSTSLFGEEITDHQRNAHEVRSKIYKTTNDNCVKKEL